MATTDYDFTLTRNQIIEAAYRKIGVLDSGQVLDGSLLMEGNIALNLVVKDWLNRGIFLWKQEKRTQALVANDKDYTLANDILHVSKAYYTDGTLDTPVGIITYPDYLDIPDKDAQSEHPLSIALDYAPTARVMWVYPEPSASLTLTYLATIRGKDMDTSSGTPEIPQEMLKSLIYDLASDLADDVRLDIRERSYLTGKTEGIISQAKKRDIEHDECSVVASAYPTRRR
jgi:hypothetical protein